MGAIWEWGGGGGVPGAGAIRSVGVHGVLWARFGDPLLFYSAQDTGTEQYWSLILVADIFAEATKPAEALWCAAFRRFAVQGVIGRLHERTTRILLFLLSLWHSSAGGSGYFPSR